MDSRTRARWLSRKPCAVKISLLFLFLSSVALPLPAQDTKDDPAAIAIAQTAQTAQNNADYELAAQQWTKLLTEFPKSTLAPKARFYSGICAVRLEDFPQAIERLGLAVESLGKEEVQKKAQALLYLGFSQARLGQQKLAADAESADGQKLLADSTKSLDLLLKDHADFEDADQACFFQGEAYEQLGQLKEAAASYKKIQDFEKQTFKFEGLYALANVNELQGELVEALKYYDMFRKESESAGGNPLATEVDFRTAETLIKLAKEDAKRGDPEAAKKNYASADKLLMNVSTDQTFQYKDQAKFQQAFCAYQLEDFGRAGDLYDSVSNMQGTELGPRASVYAGRAYLRANDSEKAIASLTKSTENDSEYAAEGAHWLSQLNLRAGKLEDAYQLADTWIKKAAEHPFCPQLMLDRADAAYLLDARRKESPKLFLEIADKFPKNSLADSAIYNAAYAYLEIGELENAIKTADRFIDTFEKSAYMADTLEVKADASLLKGETEQAETIFRRLVQEYTDNDKAPIWNIRVGLASHLLGNHKETIDWLTPRVDLLPEKAQQAEALHWIGTSHFRLGENEKAVATLQQSINTDPKWRRGDETHLGLARAQFAADMGDEAIKTSSTLIKTFPNSPLAAESFFRLGEFAYAKDDFDVARTNYESVTKTFPESDFVPAALYGIAWSNLKEDKFKEAQKEFTELIDKHPGHELAQRALVGRGACLRQTGNAELAIKDIQAFLDASKDEKAKNDARYEMGLALVDQKKWPEVVATFEELIKADKDSPLMDRYLYELAWGHQYQNEKEKALDSFSTIAQTFTKSPLAPEASFHVGGQLYDEKKYSEAAEMFEKCANSTAEDLLREKAAYKLAWCHYKRDDYGAAHTSFEKQVTEFPKGSLLADGAFMVAESLFRQKQYKPALKSYQTAQPIVETSTDVQPRIKWLTRLHGAQSANQLKEFQTALDMATPITTSTADDSYKKDAWLEIGNAHSGLKQNNEAVEAWSEAVKDNPTKTGARAQCMIGDAYFAEKDFTEALIAYKLVMYGYSGKDSAADIKPLQAYAAYEAGTCNFVQIKDAEPALRKKLIAEAEKHYRFLVNNYPNDALVEATKKQLTTIEKLKAQQ